MRLLLAPAARRSLLGRRRRPLVSPFRSSIQPKIRSAIWRWFLFIIIVWLSPRMPMSAEFLRNGGGGAGSADRELVRSIHNYVDRAREGRQGVTQFSRLTAMPFSTLAGSFLIASRLGDQYWSLPLSETALDSARPFEVAGGC
jgi:hypothetical protein